MKRLLTLTILYLCLAVPAHAVITFTTRKASNFNAGFGNTVAATITSQAAGNTNLVGILFFVDVTAVTTPCTNASTFTVTDGTGNTYVQDIRVNMAATSLGCMAIMRAANIGANASNTITLTVTSETGSTYYAVIVTSEWTGFAASPVDQTGSTDLTSTAMITTVTATGATTQNDELIYAFFLCTGGVTQNAGTSYTLLNQPISNVIDEYQIVTTTATYSATATSIANTTDRHAFLITYKALIAGTTPPRRRVVNRD